MCWSAAVVPASLETDFIRSQFQLGAKLRVDVPTSCVVEGLSLFADWLCLQLWVQVRTGLLASTTSSSTFFVCCIHRSHSMATSGTFGMNGSMLLSLGTLARKQLF